MFVSSLAVEPGPISASREEILNEARAWLKDSPAASILFERFQSSSGVNAKRLIIPASEVRALTGSKQRSEIFLTKGGPLLERVAHRAIKESGISPDQISTVIYTSCTSPTIPAVDATILPRIGVSPTATRLPIYQHGCAGGVVAFSLAPKFTAPGSATLLLSLELCSLGFYPEDVAAAGLVGAAIFADGAAAAVITNEGPGMKIIGSHSVLIPETEYLMGYDIHDNGAHLRLDKELPQSVLAEAKRSLPEFLAKHGKKVSDVDYWLFHPGGAKILDHMESELHLQRSQCRWSWETLQNVGNMSSTSIYFVMRGFMDSEEGQSMQQRGGTALLVGIGPGLTLQYVLLEASPS